MCSKNKNKLTENISKSSKNNNSDELFHSAYGDYKKNTDKELRANSGTIDAIKSLSPKEKEKNK